MAKKRSLIEDAKFEHNILHAQSSIESHDNGLVDGEYLTHKLMVSLDNQIDGLKIIVDKLKVGCTKCLIFDLKKYL